MLVQVAFASALHWVPRACIVMRGPVGPHPVPEIESFLSDVALTMPPPALSSLVGLLMGSGEEVLTPGADATLHPLLVPLTRRPEDGEVTGLLRWPAAGGGGSKMPVVRTYDGGRQLELLADCTEHFVAKAAVDADASGAPDAAELAKLAANAMGLTYEAGTARKFPGGAPGYLITKVGPFLSAYKQLALKHAEGGSLEAALITCERTQRSFQAWGHPYAFHSRLLARANRVEEARDMARFALGLPLWTLGDDVAELCGLAQTSTTELATSLREKADGKLSLEQKRAQNGMEQRTPAQIAKDRASYLLDLVVASPGEYSWEGVRAELASLYRAAGMPSIATFVSSPTAGVN